MDSTSEAVFQFVYEPGPYDPVIAPGFGISIHSKPAMDGHCLHYVYPDERIGYKENSIPRFLIGLMVTIQPYSKDNKFHLINICQLRMRSCQRRAMYDITR
ncbi:MAG: hypothetical protein GX640_03645, partial [Fibrobacter sp.]|nr:hypothetical protein [Fibrobacter sp.]